MGVTAFPLKVILDYYVLSHATVLFLSVLRLVLAHKGETLRVSKSCLALWSLNIGVISCSSLKKIMANTCYLHQCGVLLHEKSAGLVEASFKKTINSVNVTTSSIEIL